MDKYLSSEYREYIASDRWIKGWRRTWTMWMMLGGDALLPFLPAHHADHLHYKNLGHELPFRDILPLNRRVHLEVVTPVRAILRKQFGSTLGNHYLAFAMRAIVLFWWGLMVLGTIGIIQLFSRAIS